MLWRAFEEQDADEIEQNDDNVIQLRVRLFKAQDEEHCSIFHERISEVEIEGAPTDWGKEYCNANAAQLDCGHTFHASALAIHFMTHKMSCPVCRKGAQNGKMEMSKEQ